jgi:hypothetical protein
MPVGAYEDPWLPLDRAYGDLPHEMYGANGVIARWATCAMAALAELRRDKRTLSDRTAALNDRVSAIESGMVDMSGKLDALEAKINDTGSLLAAGVNGVVDRLNDELGTLFKDEVRRLDTNVDNVMRYVRTVEAQIERLRDTQPDTEKGDPEEKPVSSGGHQYLVRAVALGEMLRKDLEIEPGWLDRVAQCADASIEELARDGRRGRPAHCLGQDVPILIAEIVRLRDLIPFITDDRWDADSALTHKEQWEAENGR